MDTIVIFFPLFFCCIILRYILDGLMCLKDEYEAEEYERKRSLMTYSNATDDISASLTTILQDETTLLEDGRIAYLNVRLPADVNIALMHEATNSIKSNEQSSLDSHYRQVLFEHPHKLAAGIEVNLEHTWPMNEIVSKESLGDYTKIISRLMEIGGAIWQAQGIWQALVRCSLFTILNKDRRGMHRQSEDSKEETCVYISPEMSSFLDKLHHTRLGMHQCMYVLQSISQSYLMQIHENIFPRLLDNIKNKRNIITISCATVQHKRYTAQVCIMISFARDKIDQIISTAGRALRCLDIVLNEFNKYEYELRRQEASITNKKNRKTVLEQVEDIIETNDVLKDNLSIADSNFKNSIFYAMRLLDDLKNFLDDVDMSDHGYTSKGISQEDYHTDMQEWASHLKTILSNISHDYKNGEERRHRAYF